jgi:hypothetical protein
MHIATTTIAQHLVPPLLLFSFPKLKSLCIYLPDEDALILKFEVANGELVGQRHDI